MKRYVVDLTSGESQLLMDSMTAWGISINEINAEIHWRFTTDDAGIKSR